MTEKQRQELCERFSQIFAVANPDPNVPFEKFIYDALLKAFIAGAEYAWNNPNWISVKDALPEKDNEFEDYSKLVVVTDGKDFYKGMYNYGGECWLTHDLWPIEDATYWMECQLQQPPRKEE